MFLVIIDAAISTHSMRETPSVAKNAVTISTDAKKTVSANIIVNCERISFLSNSL